MTTTVTLTGTGVPHPSAGRAGAGVLVSCGDVHLQFDAGRGTVVRLADAGLSPADLTAQFLTHYHSDHVIDLVDVVITRWVMRQLRPTPPLDIVVPEGPTRTSVQRMLEPYDDDILIRREHEGAEPIDMHVTPSEARRSSRSSTITPTRWCWGSMPRDMASLMSSSLT